MRPLPLLAILGALAVGTGSVPAQDAAPSRGGDADGQRLIGPRHGEERDAALRMYGGNADTEKAVEAGLDWLARHLDKDGLWDADGFPKRCKAGKRCDGVGKGHHGEDVPCPFDDALSALAVLAFLGNGHVPDPKGDERARLVETALGRLRGGDPWSRALSLQCFAEAEAMERKGRWSREVEAGVRDLLGARQKDGAWGYIAGMRPGSDVPFTALVVQALLAARDAGADLPADLGERVDSYLDTLEESKGRLAYLVDGRKYGYTPTSHNAHLAAAMRELLDAGTKGSRHRAHMGLLAAKPPAWKISWRTVDVPGRGKIPVQVGNLDMLQWWHGTIATFHAGGGAWSKWWGKTRSALVPHQRDDGCARGSWDPEGLYEKKVGGRLMSTALGVLMLEQPYRHRRRP